MGVRGQPVNIGGAEALLPRQAGGESAGGLGVRSGIFQQRKNFLLDREFARVRKLETVAGENLDAIVGPWIVRGGDHDPGIEFSRAREISNTGSGDHARAVNLDTNRMQSESEAIGDPTARLTRVLTNDGAGFGVDGAQIVAQSSADQKNTFMGKREISGYAANTVSTKELARSHCGCVLDGEFSGSIVTVMRTERGLETWMRGSET